MPWRVSSAFSSRCAQGVDRKLVILPDCDQGSRGDERSDFAGDQFAAATSRWAA